MGDPVIEAHDLTKHYGRTVGLEGLDLTVERGEVFGFLGPNGAGKTTTIRLLLDLIRPTRGEVRLFGRPASDPLSRARVGYLPGELQLDERLTGRRMLDYLDGLRPRGSAPADPRRRAELCERLGLTAADLGRLVRDDSHGTKQKVGLVSAFERDPDLLVLDEPTSGLDPLVRAAVFDLLAEASRAGRTVFHSSHVVSEVDRTCTRVGFVREGRLVGLEPMDRVRRAATRTMVVRFAGGAPIEELRSTGAEIIGQDDGEVTLSVRGEVADLLRVLARHEVRDLIYPEHDLEEVFARYYRRGGGGAS
jgi:beta-exotoxin I transport system ATP-binding protein